MPGTRRYGFAPSFGYRPELYAEKPMHIYGKTTRSFNNKISRLKIETRGLNANPIQMHSQICIYLSWTVDLLSPWMTPMATVSMVIQTGVLGHGLWSGLTVPSNWLCSGQWFSYEYEAKKAVFPAPHWPQEFKCLQTIRYGLKWPEIVDFFKRLYLKKNTKKPQKLLTN